MAALINHDITNVADFAKLISEELARTRARCPNGTFKKNWYRGHSKASYLLKPSLFRHPNYNRWKDLFELEGKMLAEFCRQSFLHGSLTVNEGKLLETLFSMQHYGVPTRLLDWTLNPFIALYFALTDAPMTGAAGEPSVVWIIDPTAWNKTALEDLGWAEQGPASPQDDVLKSYYPVTVSNDAVNPYDHPVAVLGLPNNARMFAQKGVFTIAGKSLESMETIFAAAANNFVDGALTKVTIPAANLSTVLDDLISMGYTDSVTYPDLQGLALEIRRLNGFRG